MNIARIILDRRCNRNCDGCYNNYHTLMKERHCIHGDLSTLFKDYPHWDAFCLTGGEPTLFPEYVLYAVNQIRENSPDSKIYLYTALFSHTYTDQLVRCVDGVHYTLHYPCTWMDRNGFEKFQQIASRYNGKKSFRLYIDQRIRNIFCIQPNLWTRVEIKPWIPEGKCPLPEGETLFEWMR